MSRRASENGIRWVAVALVLAALLVHAFWAGIERIADMDLWWAMAAGRYIVEHGTVPDHDVLSYTHAGAPWFNSEWLSQVLYFELYRHGGGIALVAFKVTAVMAMFVLVAWIGWRRSGSLVLAVAAAVIAAYIGRRYFDIRAQLFLFLGTLGVMAVLEAYRRGARIWVLGLLPLLMALWVNLHYSFVFGVGVLLLYVGCEGAKSWLGLPRDPLPRLAALRLTAAVALAVLATVLNPYHLRALTEPFTIIGTESAWRDEIIEWKPPVLFSEGELNPVAFSYLLILQAIAAILALASDRRRVDVTDTLLVVVTTVMALSARRFVPLFALVSAPFLANNLAVVRSRFLPRPADAPELATPRSALLASIAAVAVSGVLLVRAVPEARATFAPGIFEGLVYADSFPRNAVEFLRLNPLPARIFHPYTWGGYINFELPERKTFIDGRAHTVYPWDFYLESRTAEHGQPGWSEVLDRWEVSVVVWPSGFADGVVLDALNQLKASRRWLKIYDDGHSAVFAHVERAREWIEHFRSFTLAYPDVPGAQLFLAQAYLDAKAFGRARDQMENARRAPAAREATQQAEQGYARLVQSESTASAWFGLGFYADVNGNGARAAKAFQEALQRGLREPEATYAREALERLTPAV